VPTQKEQTTLRVLIAEQIQGLRRAKNRSLLGANEDFEREHNAVGAREKQSNNATKNNFKSAYRGADTRLAKGEKPQFAVCK
jgi:hypothetical protein